MKSPPLPQRVASFLTRTVSYNHLMEPSWRRCVNVFAMNQRLQACVDGSHTCIELTEACGEWFVRVVNDGRATVLSFELESFAMAYAEGQRLRLGLEKYDRL